MAVTSSRSGTAEMELISRRLALGSLPEHFYVLLLGIETCEPAELHDAVKEGLPYETLERLRRALGLPASRLGELIDVPARTLARRKESMRLEPDESDRLFRLARIVGLALQLFEGDLEEARAWLSRPQPALASVPPIEFTRTEVGAREVENLIGRLEHGIPT